MKTLLHLSLALFGVVLGLSALEAAPQNITLLCDGSSVYFVLTADRIGASMGATDADSWEVDTLQTVGMPRSKCTSSTTPTSLAVDLVFNTTATNVTLYLQTVFTVSSAGPAGSWNNTYFKATVAKLVDASMVPTEVFAWNVPQTQLNQVEWLNSANRTRGERCSSGEVVLNKKNKLVLSNFRLFPGTATSLPTLNDDSYALCSSDVPATVGGLAWWAWILIILGVLIVLGGLGFGGYALYQRQHH